MQKAGIVMLLLYARAYIYIYIYIFKKIDLPKVFYNFTNFPSNLKLDSYYSPKMKIIYTNLF